MTDTISIAIRKKVAALCGFSAFEVYFYDGYKDLEGVKDGQICITPRYELSLDAIIQAFDEHGLTYSLNKSVSKETGAIGYFASKDRKDSMRSFSDTAPIAMCYLFIELMEAK